MKYLTLCLLLLATTAHAGLLPNDPIAEFKYFQVPTDTQVQLCVTGGAPCGPAKSFTGGSTFYYCGGDTLSRPAGAPGGVSFECRSVITQPVVDGGYFFINGWRKLAYVGGTFQVHAPAYVSLCNIDGSQCTSPQLRYDSANVNYACATTGSIFLNYPADVTPYWCIAHDEPSLKPEPIVLPLLDYLVSTRGEIGTVPVSVSTAHDRYAVWIGSDNKAHMSFFSSIDWDEIKDFAKNLPSITNESVTSFVGDKYVLTNQGEYDFMVLTKAAFAAKFAPKYAVAPTTSGVRPYYKANNTATAIGTKLGDVAVGVPCDATKRLGTLNYLWVPSVSGWAFCALVK